MDVARSSDFFMLNATDVINSPLWGEKTSNSLCERVRGGGLLYGRRNCKSSSTKKEKTLIVSLSLAFSWTADTVEWDGSHLPACTVHAE